MAVDVAQLRIDFTTGKNDFLIEITEKYSQYCVDYMLKRHQCSEDEAKDLFAEAILVFRDAVIRKKLTKVRKVQNYLLGTCIKLHQLQLRQDYRKVDKAAEIKERLYGENTNFLDATVSEETNSELIRITMTSFHQLGEKCQQLLRLYYVHHFSLNEIAEEMGFATHNVAKTTKYRCYQQWMKFARELKN